MKLLTLVLSLTIIFGLYRYSLLPTNKSSPPSPPDSTKSSTTNAIYIKESDIEIEYDVGDMSTYYYFDGVEFHKNAFIQLHQENRKISGNDGCNKFHGLLTKFKEDPSKVRVSELAKTKMMCFNAPNLDINLLSGRVVVIDRPNKHTIILTNDKGDIMIFVHPVRVEIEYKNIEGGFWTFVHEGTNYNLGKEMHGSGLNGSEMGIEKKRKLVWLMFYPKEDTISFFMYGTPVAGMILENLGR
jgi:hypothetical protein